MNLPNINYGKLLYVAVFVYLCWPFRFAMIYYENYGADEIFDNLIKKTSKNITVFRDKGVQCVRIDEIIERKRFFKISSVGLHRATRRESFLL